MRVELSTEDESALIVALVRECRELREMCEKLRETLNAATTCGEQWEYAFWAVSVDGGYMGEIYSVRDAPTFEDAVRLYREEHTVCANRPIEWRLVFPMRGCDNVG